MNKIVVQQVQVAPTMDVISTPEGNSCEMHSCLRITMRISRWVGVFPVEGLDRADNGRLWFNVRSLYTIYYLTTLTLLTLITGFYLKMFVMCPLTLSTLSTLIFYVSCLTSAICLLKLATEWPGLIRRAAKIERRVAAIRVANIRAVKFNVITYVVLLLATLEHMLSLVYKAKDVALCYGKGVLGTNILVDYYRHMFTFVFDYVPCNLFTISICTVVTLQATFLWNFTDVMIMCFSMYLTSYFRDLNTLVSSQKNKKIQDWDQLRNFYSQLVALVNAVDAKMCYLILLSVLVNLFFICMQLFNTLKSSQILHSSCELLVRPQRTSIDKGINLFYFSFSLMFLIFRASSMLFLAANVNTAAIEPKYALYDVSTRYYNIHVQRFNRQLRYTTNALSGLFFYVTREMILKVFASIITYELVLLQFNR